MDERARTPMRTFGDVAFIATLAVATLLPMAGRALDPSADGSTRAERRVAGREPGIPRNWNQVRRYPRSVDAWLGDRFGFRGRLIRWHNVVKLFGFGVSPTDELAIGPRGWIFTTVDRAIEAHRGLAPLGEEQLELWRIALEERRDWLAEQGAHYLVVVAAGKPTIYPEELPAAIRAGAVTPLDQFMEYMARHSDVAVIDVREALLAAKADDHPGDRVYFRYGTHWTPRGNHVAYTEILNALRRWFPTLEPWPASAFTPEPSNELGDHWGGRLRMTDLLPEGAVLWIPNRPRRARPAPDHEAGSIGITQVLDSALPRGLLVHDSFGYGLLPYLSEHFARLRTSDDLWLDTEVVERERPDVVILVMVERKLLSDRFAPLFPGGEDVQRTFAASDDVCLRIGLPGTLAALEPWRDSRISLVDGTIELRCRRSGQGALLPAFELPAGCAPVVRIDVTSERATRLNLLFKTDSADEYTQKRRTSAELSPGRTVLYLALPAPDLADRVLLFPEGRGTLRLHAIEVRAVPY